MTRTASVNIEPPGNINSHWDVPTVHPVYFRLCMQTLRSEGVDIAPLLVDAGLGSWSELTHRSDPFPYRSVHRLIQLILSLDLKPQLPLEFGATVQVSAHGPMGLAVVSSKDLRQALQTLERYTTLRSANFKYRFKERAGAFSFELVDLIGHHTISRERNFFYALMFSLIVRMLEAVSGAQVKRMTASLPFKKPLWSEEFRRYFQGDLRFGAPGLAFRGSAELLDLPCATADAFAYAQACQECDRLMMQKRETSLEQQINGLLSARNEDYPPLPEVAKALNLSTRTLARRLTDEGTSFQALLDAVRQQKAHWYLSQTNLKVEEIAVRLGYAHLSGFSRACLRWFGHGPSYLRMGLPSK